jgi:acid stress-induced BolA-like protein IbaG/YrbA
MSVVDTREEPEDLGLRMPTNHHVVTIFLGAKIEVDNPGLHHHRTIIAHDMEEVEDPNLHGIRMTTKTTKSRWERHALLAEFAGRQYPKDSSYHMISRSTTDLRNRCHGCWIIYKQ